MFWSSSMFMIVFSVCMAFLLAAFAITVSLTRTSKFEVTGNCNLTF